MVGKSSMQLKPCRQRDQRDAQVFGNRRRARADQEMGTGVACFGRVTARKKCQLAQVMHKHSLLPAPKCAASAQRARFRAPSARIVGSSARIDNLSLNLGYETICCTN